MKLFITIDKTVKKVSYFFILISIILLICQICLLLTFCSQVQDFQPGEVIFHVLLFLHSERDIMQWSLFNYLQFCTYSFLYSLFLFFIDDQINRETFNGLKNCTILKNKNIRVSCGQYHVLVLTLKVLSIHVRREQIGRAHV